MKSIYLRLDIHKSIGMGHIKRCLTIASHLKYKSNIHFIVSCTRDVSLDILSGFNYTRLDFDDQNLEDPTLYIKNGSIVILDFSHRINYERTFYVEKYLKELSNLNTITYIIDGSKEDSLFHHLKNISCTYLVTPYLNEKSRIGNFINLTGLDFYVFSKEIQTLSRSPNKGEILISLGGTDDNFLNFTIAKALIHNQYNHPVNIIVGNLVDHKFFQQLVDLVSDYKNFKVLNFQNSLAPFLRTCEKAIISSGLTKYDLAFLNIPSIIISTTPVLQSANESFAKSNTGIHLDYNQEFEYKFTDALNQLNSHEVVEALILNCKNLKIDERSKLINHIESEYEK